MVSQKSNEAGQLIRIPTPTHMIQNQQNFEHKKYEFQQQLQNMKRIKEQVMQKRKEQKLKQMKQAKSNERSSYYAKIK